MPRWISGVAISKNVPIRASLRSSQGNSQYRGFSCSYLQSWIRVVIPHASVKPTGAGGMTASPGIF
jgi:hypothetical protein